MVADVKGLEIKILRCRAGIWQYEFAARLVISANSLSEIESERRQSSPELLKRIIRLIKDIPNGNRAGK